MLISSFDFSFGNIINPLSQTNVESNYTQNEFPHQKSVLISIFIIILSMHS